MIEAASSEEQQTAEYRTRKLESLTRQNELIEEENRKREEVKDAKVGAVNVELARAWLLLALYCLVRYVLQHTLARIATFGSLSVLRQWHIRLSAFTFVAHLISRVWRVRAPSPPVRGTRSLRLPLLHVRCQ